MCPWTVICVERLLSFCMYLNGSVWKITVALQVEDELPCEESISWAMFKFVRVAVLDAVAETGGWRKWLATWRKTSTDGALVGNDGPCSFSGRDIVF